MYAKFAAAIICIALCSLNVVAAVKRTPIRTTLTGSTRTTIEMMPSPNSSVHWMSAIIFIAGFASFLGWGISDYNWVLDILQPGYLKFYELSDVTQKINFPISTAIVSQPKPKPKPTDSICNNPLNNFEKLLSSTNSSCQNANKTRN